MLARLAARPSIGATPLRRTRRRRARRADRRRRRGTTAGRPERAGPAFKRRPTDPGPPTIRVTTNGTSAKNTMLEQPEGIERDVRLQDPEALVAEQRRDEGGPSEPVEQGQERRDRMAGHERAHGVLLLVRRTLSGLRPPSVLTRRTPSGRTLSPTLIPRPRPGTRSLRAPSTCVPPALLARRPGTRLG